MDKEIDKGGDEGEGDIDLSTLPAETDWKAKAQELEQKRREDGIRSRERNKALKDRLASIEASVKPPEKKDEKKEPSELDHGLIEKTFFKASGINDPEVMQLAREFAKRTGDTLDVVLDDEIFKARAEKLLTTKANADATSIKTNRSGNVGSGQQSVEYWLAKDQHPPKELGSKLAQEYVQAKRNLGKDKKMFYNDN